MKSLILFCSLLWASYALSQNEASNWYFGYGAGLKFDSTQGTVRSVNDGKLSTNEGCTSISDDNGNLLFYTDGKTVYNSQHSVMQNGDRLYGDASSSQSAIIAPKPNDPNVYYIFTVDNFLDNVNYGLNYSIVDISLNNGLGAVVDKNINLLELCTEKITVVQKNCITGSLWLVTLASENGRDTSYNTYHAFEISEEGINLNSVKSTFNIGGSGFGVNDLRGYLVLSPDGSSLASANMNEGLYLYDFDAFTGIVSNQRRLFLDNRADKPYGVAYSPNNRFLYVHSSNDYFNQQNPNENNNASNHFSVLTQFDISAEDIQSTGVVIDAQNLYRGALQLGPNGKIYRALSATYDRGISFLGAINRPNELGSASNYIHNSVSLSPNQSAQGLPPFIQSLFNTDIDIIQNGTDSSTLYLCDGDTYTLSTEAIQGATYIWTKNGDQLSETTHQLDISQPGRYELYVDPNNGECPLEGEAFIIYQDLPEVLDYEITQCDIDGNPDGLTDFNLEEALRMYEEDYPGYTISFHKTQSNAIAGENSISELDFRNISNPEILYVRSADNNSGCYEVSELMLIGSAVDVEELAFSVCDDDGNNDGFYTFDLDNLDLNTRPNSGQEINVRYYKTQQDALLENSPLPTTYTNTIAEHEIIFARYENDEGCIGISAIELIVNKLPEIDEEAEFKYCLNFYPETITLGPGLKGQSESLFTFMWSTGETTPQIEVNEIGTYTLTVTNSLGCKSQRVLTVTPSNIATITNIEIDDAAANNTVLISATGEGNYEYAIDSDDNFQTENSFLDINPGLHTVFVRDKNDCGVVEQLVSVIGFPKFFSPNADGFNDTWQVKGISDEFQPETIIYIYDRYGKLLKELSPLSKGWDGTFNNQPLPANDYWFTVHLEDGRTFTNHFSLRN